ncbi:hypothetical protein HRI_003667700 [Hibiscus trionum]|uniref:Uncharacterized protein n=1 Tax=Hibiscus trionum TaxID=183268 RepID=A0A9W7IPU2_HIBTR|nr:hypothetical protein HRI_003667700 [Hibiscus trionum]
MATSMKPPKERWPARKLAKLRAFPKKWEGDEGPLEMAFNFLKKNKVAAVSVVIAFSVAVFICRTFD